MTTTAIDKHLRLEYRLRDDVEVETYLPKLAQFVANMQAHHASHDYTAYRDLEDPRHFVHVGHFASAEVDALVSQAWFKTFTTTLRELVIQPPDVTQLAAFASTRA